MKTTKTKIRSSNRWFCNTCGGKDMGYKAAMDHLRTTHKIDTKNTPAEREVVMHVDGAKFYSCQFAWTIAGVTLTQNTIHPRKNDDPMGW